MENEEVCVIFRDVTLNNDRKGRHSNRLASLIGHGFFNAEHVIFVDGNDPLETYVARRAR